MEQAHFAFPASVLFVDHADQPPERRDASAHADHQQVGIHILRDNERIADRAGKFDVASGLHVAQVV